MRVLFSVFFAKVEVVCFVDFYPQIRSMASHSLARLLLMFAGMRAFSCKVMRSGYTPARVFAGVLQQSLEEVILKTSPKSPATWALFVLDYTYLWIFALFLYLIVRLCSSFLHHLNTLSLHHRDILSSFTQLYSHRLWL